MRTFVGSVLEAAGDYIVDEVGDGFDALRLVPRADYDLVITDINMPDINGLELIRFVRGSAHHREVPVLIISTQSAERDRARGLALGADAFLAKPFTPEALVRAVSQSLSARPSLRGGPGPASAGGGAV